MKILEKMKRNVINVDAQKWLNEKYPKNGTCQRDSDKGKKRKDITHLDIRKGKIGKGFFKGGKNLRGSLKLEGFTILQILNCSGHELISLDVSNCFNLEEVNAENCSELSEDKIIKPNNGFVYKFEKWKLVKVDSQIKSDSRANSTKNNSSNGINNEKKQVSILKKKELSDDQLSIELQLDVQTSEKKSALIPTNFFVMKNERDKYFLVFEELVELLTTDSANSSLYLLQLYFSEDEIYGYDSFYFFISKSRVDSQIPIYYWIDESNRICFMLNDDAVNKDEVISEIKKEKEKWDTLGYTEKEDLTQTNKALVDQGIRKNLSADLEKLSPIMEINYQSSQRKLTQGSFKSYLRENAKKHWFDSKGFLLGISMEKNGDSKNLTLVDKSKWFTDGVCNITWINKWSQQVYQEIGNHWCRQCQRVGYYDNGDYYNYCVSHICKEDDCKNGIEQNKGKGDLCIRHARQQESKGQKEQLSVQIQWNNDFKKNY